MHTVKLKFIIIDIVKMAATFDLRRLTGSRGFEAIRPATKICLLCQLISVYVIIKMAAAHTKAHCLVTRRNLLLLCEYY